MLTTIVLISRTIIIYLFIILIIYLIKKDKNQKIKELDTLTIWLTLILSSNLIINYDRNIFIYLIPIITLFLLREFVKLLFIESNHVKNIFEHDPIILVKNSKVYFKNMVVNNYSIDKLLEELRKKGIYTLQDIKYIFLEPSGEISIFPYDKDKFEMYPIPVILDGKMNVKVLQEMNIKEVKIKKMLYDDNLKVEDIYYAMYEKNKLFIIRNEELK